MSKRNGLAKYDLPDNSYDCMKEADRLRAEIGGSHKRLRILLVEGYVLAEQFKKNKVAFQHLRTRPYWRGFPPSDVLRGTMRYINDAPTTSGANYERSCNYTVALKSAWDQGTPADKIAGIIDEAGGIEALYCRGKEIRRKAKMLVDNPEPETIVVRAVAKQIDGEEGDGLARTSNAPFNGHHDDADEEDSAASVLDGEDLREDTGNPLTGNISRFVRNGRRQVVSPRRQAEGGKMTSDSVRLPRKYSRGWCEQRLLINTLPETLLLQILELRIDSDDHVLVEIRRATDDRDGFKHFTATRHNA